MNRMSLGSIQDLPAGSFVVLENVSYFKLSVFGKHYLKLATAIYICSVPRIHGFICFYLLESKEFMEIEKFSALRCLTFYS